jgi:hypothetical protein
MYNCFKDAQKEHKMPNNIKILRCPLPLRWYLHPHTFISTESVRFNSHRHPVSIKWRTILLVQYV